MWMAHGKQLANAPCHPLPISHRHTAAWMRSVLLATSDASGVKPSGPGPPVTFPLIMGSDISGEIVALGLGVLSFARINRSFSAMIHASSWLESNLETLFRCRSLPDNVPRRF